MLKVIGIDVGTAIVGWAVVSYDKAARNQLFVEKFGTITTDSKIAMPSRLKQIWEELSNIIEVYKPQHIAIESIFYFKNQKTVMTVSQARGVMLLAAEQAGLKTYEYTPLQVKTGVTGYGRADKAQVQKMVQMILGLKEIPKPDDAADALAIAINHINSLPNKLRK